MTHTSADTSSHVISVIISFRNFPRQFTQYTIEGFKSQYPTPETFVKKILDDTPGDLMETLPDMIKIDAAMHTGYLSTLPKWFCESYYEKASSTRTIKRNHPGGRKFYFNPDVNADEDTTRWHEFLLEYLVSIRNHH